ncbi:MAG: PqqD family peptide modification chaperone [Burkholderiales bacterium]|jgi:putative peptide zinc metalloprotease protein|nr:MAG: PqqD family peptide modification chaperone [Burkholderiales bacterium]
MQETLLSPYWYRIARLHPRLRAHVSVRMQRTRGQAWYVLHNQATGRHHRVNAQAFELVGRLDGRLTVDEIWQSLLNRQGDAAPSQNDVIRILGQLTDAGLVQAEVTPDVRQILHVGEERQRKEKRTRLNPLSFRLGLFNPSALLETLYPRIRGLFKVQTLMAWMVLMLAGMLGIWFNWPDIRIYGQAHFLTPRFLAMVWVLYPLMKGVHELGHALMLRRFGCEVPEVGINFFMFVPMPYVDASASNRLTSRAHRGLVASAGIMVEMTLAVLGLGLWLAVEDGLVRELAFTLMTVGGLSTLLFNGNPLMKFDGYFVACDVLDLPNLAQRSTLANERMWQGLVARLLRMPVEPRAPSEHDALERWVLRLYSPASWGYRLTVSWVMVSWAAEKASWLGMGILAWMVWSLVLQPCRNWGNNLQMAAGFESVRTKALWGGGVAAAGALAMLALVPVPASVVADGVVWLPPDAQVRATSDAEVDAVLVRSGQRVVRGQALIRLKDPVLLTQRAILMSQIDGTRAELNGAFGIDPLKVSNAQQALNRDYAQLGKVDEDLAGQVLRAVQPGEFVLSRQEDIDQRQVSRGQLLAYVMSDVPTVVRAVISQRDIEDVKERLKGVTVMLSERPGKALKGKPSGEAPAAIDKLPSAALSNKQGGPVPVEPTDTDGIKPAEPTFMVDVVLDERIPRAGGLAKVKLELTPRPLLQTWGLRLRQLFLKHFSDVRGA